jgi:ABC-type glycerol-3-phosphate transport system substrate-binding protein
MVGVNPGSKVKDDAIKLALWHGSAAAQNIIGQAEFMPASLAAVQSVYLDPKIGPSNRAVLGKVLALSQPEPSPDIVTFSQAMAPVGPEISAMFQGKETVTDGLRKAQQQVAALLLQAGKG